jgi:hypothetical protein
VHLNILNAYGSSFVAALNFSVGHIKLSAFLHQLREFSASR